MLATRQPSGSTSGRARPASVSPVSWTAPTFPRAKHHSWLKRQDSSRVKNAVDRCRRDNNGLHPEDRYRCGRVYPVARRRRDRGRPCEREYCLLHGCPLQNGGYKGDVHRRKRRGVPDWLPGTLHITGDQGVCRAALEIVQAHYRKKGIELDLYNPTYRYADLAFARTVPVEEVGSCFPASRCR